MRFTIHVAQDLHRVLRQAAGRQEGSRFLCRDAQQDLPASAIVCSNTHLQLRHHHGHLQRRRFKRSKTQFGTPRIAGGLIVSALSLAASFTFSQQSHNARAHCQRCIAYLRCIFMSHTYVACPRITPTCCSHLCVACSSYRFLCTVRGCREYRHMNAHMHSIQTLWSVAFAHCCARSGGHRQMFVLTRSIQHFVLHHLQRCQAQ